MDLAKAMIHEFVDEMISLLAASQASLPVLHGAEQLYRRIGGVTRRWDLIPHLVCPRQKLLARSARMHSS